MTWQACAARGRAIDTDELAAFVRAQLTKIVAELGERQG